MHAESNLKCLLEYAEPELSTLKRRIVDLEAKSKGVAEEYLVKHHSPFIEDNLVELLPERLKIPQLTTYKRE